MSLIIDTVASYLPPKRKATPSGWISFNAVCCHHNGDSADRRQRGGIMLAEGVSYHCFNCGFKASWQPGRPITKKFKNLLQWLNVPDDIIAKCTFEALRLKDEVAPEHTLNLNPTFFDKAMPMGTKPIKEWFLDPPDKLIPVLEYLISRGFTVDDYDWHWTDESGFDDRLIVPFYYQKRLVGYTARLIRERKTAKYISEQQPGYVFNLDNQHWDRKFVLVTEGPLDAVCVDGVAVMSNEIGPQQRHLISRLQREIVVVPDRDASSIKMIEQALEWGWSVSMPDWPNDIKDVNDAVKRYGKLYVLWSILQAKESMPLKIQLRMKQWTSHLNKDKKPWQNN
jgi:hypothetical protein